MSEYVTTIMLLIELSLLSKRKLACQIEPTSWKDGHHPVLLGKFVDLRTVCAEIEQHGYRPAPAQSDFQRVLLSQSKTEVIQVNHAEGAKHWVIPIGTTVSIAGCKMVV